MLLNMLVTYYVSFGQIKAFGGLKMQLQTL